MARSLNEKHRTIFDNILYKEYKHPNQPLYIFIIEGVDIHKTFTLLNSIQALLHFYVKLDKNMDPLKATNLKMTYTDKVAININDTTIHPILAIPINKNLDQLTNLSDEKRDVLIKEI
jgi:hypothetical protein